MVKTQLPMKRGLWSNEDHDENERFVRKEQKKETGNWTSFSKRSACFSGLRSSGKKSKQRWSNEEKGTDPRDNNFTPQEEELVIKLHAAIGSRWPIIAQQLPGQTETDVKILWNTKLRKKLSAMGIDPVTHKPFTQILADYGNIGAFPKDQAQIAHLALDSAKNPFLLKQEQPQRHQQSTFEFCSQLHAINMVTDTSNYTNTTNCNMRQTFNKNHCVSSSEISSSLDHELSSFCWSDFLLDDEFLTSNVEGAQENLGTLEQKCDAVVDFGANWMKLIGNGFEASSSPSNGSFVEAMIEHQDEIMFLQFPGFDEEPFNL
ncbi:transcription factor MYB92-like [Primulina huaijiensis]|uniref:transcription factor MYB92-like n=1 Tax=Primulina huaijiensis TaxID=1492673 RepID=UPI003CC7926A